MQGVYKISMEEYLADPCPAAALSNSMIPLLLDAPIKAWWNHPRLNPEYRKEEKDQSKFDPGTACHNLLFEGGKNVIEITGFDDWRKNDAKEARDDARKAGKTPLLSKQYDICCAMTEATRKFIRECDEIEVNDLVTEGDVELTYIWQEKNGIWCKARPDWIRKDKKLILDYKTTGTTANPDEFGGHMARMDYPIQSVFYRRGVKKVDGANAEFVFIAQEDEPPYLCSIHGIDMFNEQMADEKIEWAIKKWHDFLTTGKWPGYPKRICYQEPKPWDLAAWELLKARLEETA